MRDEDVKQKIEPLFGRVLVRPVEVEFEGHESRLIRPDISQDAPEFGVVVAAAEDCAFVGPGDVVMFGKYSGYGFADEEFLSLRERDIHSRVHGVRVKPRKGEEPRIETLPGIIQP